MSFYLDYQTYGLPNVGLSQTQSDQFRPVRNNTLGRGLYKSYNPTGPVVVNAQWDWPAATYRQFRLAWEDVSELMYGAHWFEADLPLGLVGDFASSGSGVVTEDVLQQIQLTVGTDGTNYGFNDNPLYGSRSPQQINPLAENNISDMRSNGVNIFYLRNFNGEQITGDNLVSVMFPGFSGLKLYEAVYGGDHYLSSITGIRDYLSSESGNTIQVGISFNVPSVRKYLCHFKAPFTASPIGHGSWWRMSAQLDVDTSPKMQRMLFS